MIRPLIVTPPTPPVKRKEPHPQADGIRVDRDGRLWVATRLGLQVCDQAGRVNCIIPTPNGRIANLSFGGENFDTLFATCGDRVYKRKVKVKGANAFQEPIKPRPPQL
jgi:sugar lactone lactonase YvrE